MFEWGGPNGVGGLGVLPQEKKKFWILVLKMAYFNWNDTKIWNIYIFFFANKGGFPPPCGAERGGPYPPAGTLTKNDH